jgi:hypothetical protein
VCGKPTDWVVVRNRLPRLMSRNQRQVADMLEMMAPELGFKTVRGLSDPRDLPGILPVGLTAFDPLDEARLGLKVIMAHIMARAEVRKLMQEIGLMPSVEPLDLESRVNLIVSELQLQISRPFKRRAALTPTYRSRYQLVAMARPALLRGIPGICRGPSSTGARFSSRLRQVLVSSA